MKIDGRLIASEILTNLRNEVTAFKEKPKLEIILAGNDKASLSFIRRKQSFGEKIGASVELHNLPTGTDDKILYDLTDRFNTDHSVNGIIIQRPVPIDTGNDKLIAAVAPEKDVDGFRADSLLDPPLGVAINKILEYIFRIYLIKKYKKYRTFLSEKNIVVIGRGETGGKPIANYFTKNKIKFTVVHSRTINPNNIIESADIVISCVGKKNIVRHNDLKKNCIVLGVGMHEENNKLLPDYDEKAVENVCSFYTFIPGGVGPVNVACLLENLVKAYKFQNKIA